MAVKVRVPPGMRALTGNQALVETGGASILDLVAGLEASFPGFKGRLLDESGKRRKFVNLYVNGEDIRRLQLEATPLKDNDEVEIVPAIAGG
jgi:sulfur-carrier protein